MVDPDIPRLLREAPGFNTANSFREDGSLLQLISRIDLSSALLLAIAFFLGVMLSRIFQRQQ